MIVEREAISAIRKAVDLSFFRGGGGGGVGGGGVGAFCHGGGGLKETWRPQKVTTGGPPLLCDF